MLSINILLLWNLQVVGYPHDIKGQGIYAYIITNGSVKNEAAFEKEVRAVFTKEIGSIAKPDIVKEVIMGQRCDLLI